MQNTQIVPQTNALPIATNSLFFNVELFEHVQRVAAVFAASKTVPVQYQGNVADCVIALNLSHRLNIDPYMLMQNSCVIHGKPGIEAKLAIALVDNSGLFTPLTYILTGKGDARECICRATRKSDKVVCEEKITIKMAKDAGWYSKTGSWWPKMPDRMLRYRSAAWFQKSYCPGVLMGLQTADELRDNEPVDVTPKNDALEKLDDKPGDLSVYETNPTPTPKVKKERRFSCALRGGDMINESFCRDACKNVESCAYSEEKKVIK